MRPSLSDELPSGYLPLRLLLWRARRGMGFASSPRTILSELFHIRCCRVIQKRGRAIRPRVHWQWEEMNEPLGEVGGFLRALPRLSQDVG